MTSSLSDNITFTIHGHEIRVKNVSYGNDAFSYLFGVAQVPAEGLRWVDSRHGHELWDESKTVKIAKSRPHLFSGGEPELMIYVPAEERFVDMVVLMATALMVKGKKDLEVGGKGFEAVLGIPTGSG